MWDQDYDLDGSKEANKFVMHLNLKINLVTHMKNCISQECLLLNA